MNQAKKKGEKLKKYFFKLFMKFTINYFNFVFLFVIFYEK